MKACEAVVSYNGFNVKAAVGGIVASAALLHVATT